LRHFFDSQQTGSQPQAAAVTIPSTPQLGSITIRSLPQLGPATIISAPQVGSPPQTAAGSQHFFAAHLAFRLASKFRNGFWRHGFGSQQVGSQPQVALTTISSEPQLGTMPFADTVVASKQQPAKASPITNNFTFIKTNS
jgi:hypothetical protein